MVLDDVLKMDIFFVVTTIAVVVLGVLVAAVLVRILRILKHVEHTSEKISEESERIQGDIEELRTKVKHDGLQLRHLAQFFGSLTGRERKRKDSK